MKRSFAVQAVVTAAALLTAGCLVTRPDIPKPECEVDSECSDGKTCGPGGRCIAACKADVDCLNPQVCQEGVCTTPTGLCARTSDCAANQVCALGNRCATRCTTASECTAVEACVSGACVSLALTAAQCQFDSECTAPQACVLGRCTTACMNDRDCPSPKTCQTGTCTLPTGFCAVSADCTAPQVCGSGGKCANACTTASNCAASEACVGGACVSLASGACRFTSECTAPQACIQGRCAEACMTNRDCPFGTACTNALCVPPTPECIDSTDCAMAEACSPQGECVATCTSAAQCATTGEACTNGACVRVGPDTAGLAGTIVLTGVANASNIAVTVNGPNRATGVTSADGGYSFLGLVPGRYDVTVTAAGTLEGTSTREVSARAGMTTTVPTFTFTPAGNIAGRVTLAGRTSYEGIQIVALGTGQGTVTAPDGGFDLRRIPVGAHDLLIAYTGYQAAQVPGVTVAYNQTTSINPVTLQPVPSGSTFSFASIPPTSTSIASPFSYQAVAGGGGVSSVTYAIVDGPGGMTINSNTGQVSWQPTNLNTVWVVLSATGGGATVYQMFYLEVEAAATEVYTSTVTRLRAVDAGVWVQGNGSNLAFVSNAGDVTDVTLPPDVTGTVSSIEHVNGRTVSNYAFVNGTLTSVTGPLGTLGATWQGGVVNNVAGVDVRTVQSSTLLGGTSGTAVAPTADTIASLSWPTGPITNLNDGRSTATGFSAATGIISSVSGTGFVDSAGTWATNSQNGLCVMNSIGTVRISITSHDATTFVLSQDPTGRLSAGQRYFIGSCSGYNTSYTFTDSTRASTPAASGRYLDIYSAGLQVGNFALTATTAPPNSTLTFTASISLYAALQNAATNGFYAIGYGSYDEVVITDTAAPWTASTHSQSYFLFDDYASVFDISASTTTTLTVRVSPGTLAKDRTGRKWVLADNSYNIPVTVTLTTGGLVNGAAVGQYLWVDPRGTGYSISANTANTVTLTPYYTEFPLPTLTGALVGRTSIYYYLPAITVPTPGLTAGEHTGRYLVRLTNGSTPFDTDEPILTNTASAVTLGESYCYGCIGGLSQRLASMSNLRWAPGSSSDTVDFRVALSGSPNFAVDSLQGRTVVLASNRAATGTIIRNDANSLVLQVASTWFSAFQGLATGDQLWLSDSGTGSISPLRVKLTGQGAAWTTNEWVGYSVISATGQVAGLVTANSATELDLTITNTSAFQSLSAGSNFAFARAHAEGTGCSSPGVWIRTDFTLAGATLVPSAYTHVRSSWTSGSQGRLQLYSNTNSAARAYVCANGFSNVLAMIGLPAVLDTNGTFGLTLTDTTATLAPNAHVGQYLYLSASNDSGNILKPITSNTATAFTINGIDSYEWLFYGNPYRAAQPGSRYMLTNVDEELTITATVTQPLVAGELAGHRVRAFNLDVNAEVSLQVASNTTTTLTIEGVQAYVADQLRVTGAGMLRYLSLSRGTVVRVTDSSATLTPGALVGRSLNVGGQAFMVTSNAATTITATSTSTSASASRLFGYVADATSWYVDSGSWGDEMATLPNGELLIVNNDGRVAQISQAGAITWLTAFNGAQALTVTATPLTTGLLTNASSSGSYSTTWSSSGWSFTPSALVNSYMRMRSCSTNLTNMLISGNTTTSVTAYSTVGCGNISAGWRYGIDSARLTVTGTTLTPGALAGKRLWVNGIEYLIRGNTATDITLIYGEDHSSGDLQRVVQNGGTAFVLAGLSPSASVSAVAADGTSVVVSSGTTLATWNGSAWSRTEGTQVGTLLRSGTVSFPSDSNTIVDVVGGMTPGALVGKQLLVNGLLRTVYANTSNTIDVNGSWSVQAPAAGTAYEIRDTNGLAYVQTMLGANGALWVGTGSGLHRRVGSTWTYFTAQSTESSPGAYDGLISNDIERIGVLRNGTLFFTSYYSGVSLFNGSTWTAYTVERTESASGLGDGLPSDDVNDVTLDAQGRLWFSTYSGAARFTSPSTWAQYGQAQGLDGSISGVWVNPAGEVHLALWTGLFRIVP